MDIAQLARRVVEALQSDVYNNVTLEGEPGTDYELQSVLCLYGDGKYLVLAMDGSDPSERSLHQRVLDFAIRPEIKAKQAEAMKVWEDFSDLQRKMTMDLIGQRFLLFQAPLMFIAFGRALDGTPLTALWHPQEFPSQACLEKMQSASLDILATDF